MKSYSMTTAQLEHVLAQFPSKMMERTESTVTVKGKRKTDGVVVTFLSAVKPATGPWLVLAIPGLLSAER